MKDKLSKEILYTGIVYDTLRQMGLAEEDFLLHPSIKPLDQSSVTYGPAFTNSGRVVTKDENYADLDAIRLEMYRLIKPDDVIVLRAFDTTVAHAGDITSLIYQKLGASGFVTDGLIRDGRRIRELSFPCFCTGANPIDALGYWAITEYQKPTPMPGIRRDIIINPGDYIYADIDGTIKIPQELLSDFEELLYKNFQREQKCRDRFVKIQSPSEVYSTVKSVFDEEGRW